MAALINKDSVEIRDVWAENLEREIELMTDVVVEYPYIGMDTEFPGTVIKPDGDFIDYHNTKSNVNLLKLIQLGLTFYDENGNLPTCGTGKYIVWQFNFREFNPDEDRHAAKSIKMLSDNGIDFAKNNKEGIDAKKFGELIMSSGIVLDDKVHWLTFQGSSDFGYLLKLLACKDLPDTEADFFKLLNAFFPVVYDVKRLMMEFNLHGGLKYLARDLKVERVGASHQAGSDSLLTFCCLLKLREKYPAGWNEKLEKCVCKLYGLGVGNGQIRYHKQ